MAYGLPLTQHLPAAMARCWRGRLNGRSSRRLHLGVLCHVLAIVRMDKGMSCVF